MRPRHAVRLASAALLLALAGCTTKVEILQGRWIATCSGVSVVDCEGIAKLFVNNLARSGEAIRQETNGVVFVASMDVCPELPDWAVPGTCWRASAPTRTERACMVVARQKLTVSADMAFGQAGGDIYTGLFGAPRPGTTPC